MNSTSHRVAAISDHDNHTTIRVLLVDDQAMVGESVRRMLADQPDIEFHFCREAGALLDVANRLRPTVILQDLVMPDVDGLTLVRYLRANAATRNTPLVVLSSKEEPIVKAEAFALGANDYLVKLPDKVELVARIRYHSRGYTNLLQRNDAYAQLAKKERELADQMDAAARYLNSLFPAPVIEPLRVDWRYVPSANLGGDTFGYDWLDDQSMAVFLLDVTGHGLDSALFSVTIMNVLRSRSLPKTDFYNPGEVLAGLNDTFKMSEYGGKAFTIWYGVFQRNESVLTWSGGGHPDALLFEPENPQPVRLESPGPMMGMMEWPGFEVQRRSVAPGSRLFVYSDGCHEIHLPDDSIWDFEEFVRFLSQSGGSKNGSAMDELLAHVRQIHDSPMLDDDFSIVELRF